MDIMKLIGDNLGMITSFVFGIGVIASVLGIVKLALKKVYALLGVVIGAMEDNTLTASEATAILQAGGDVVATIRTALAVNKK